MVGVGADNYYVQDAVGDVMANVAKGTLLDLANATPLAGLLTGIAKTVGTIDATNAKVQVLDATQRRYRIEVGKSK